jgi:ABC-2 type transport system permease protein
MQSQHERLPSSVSQTGTVVKYTFQNYFRARRFYVLLIIGLLISLLLILVVATRRPAAFVSLGALSFYSSWWGSVTNFVIVLSGVFFGGDAISSEFQDKTGYFLIPNPIRRSSVYVGKYISAYIASTIILGIFAAITLANGLYYYPSTIPYQYVESVIFALIYLAGVLGLSFFFSSLFKSSSISILVTLILLLFGFDAIAMIVGGFVGIEPWFILTYGGGIVSNILSSTYPPLKQTTGAGRFSFTTYNAPVLEGLAIIIGYFVVTTILGLILFERKEFN